MSTRIRTFYEADDGDIFPIYLSPEVLAIDGNTQTGPATNTRHTVKVSTPPRSFCLSPRRIVLKQFLGTVGTGDSAKNVYRTARVVITNKAAYESLSANEVVEYKGIAWDVVAVEGER